MDHGPDVRCKVYENGRVAADPETLRQLADFSEREIAKEPGLHRKPLRLFRQWRDCDAKNIPEDNKFSERTREAECRLAHSSRA